MFKVKFFFDDVNECEECGNVPNLIKKKKKKVNSFLTNCHLKMFDVRVYIIFNLLLILIFCFQNYLHKQTIIFDFLIFNK
jgi:hypothetical protein